LRLDGTAGAEGCRDEEENEAAFRLVWGHGGHTGIIRRTDAGGVP
jgi:hypothetical protein